MNNNRFVTDRARLDNETDRLHCSAERKNSNFGHVSANMSALLKLSLSSLQYVTGFYNISDIVSVTGVELSNILKVTMYKCLHFYLLIAFLSKAQWRILYGTRN